MLRGSLCCARAVPVRTTSVRGSTVVFARGTSMDIKVVVFVLAIIILIAGAIWYFAAEPTATTTTTSSVTSAATTSETPSPIAP